MFLARELLQVGGVVYSALMGATPLTRLTEVSASSISWLLVLFLFFGLAGGSDSTFTVPLPPFTPLVAAASGTEWSGATFQVSSPIVILCKL